MELSVRFHKEAKGYDSGNGEVIRSPIPLLGPVHSEETSELASPGREGVIGFAFL